MKNNVKEMLQTYVKKVYKNFKKVLTKNLGCVKL